MQFGLGITNMKILAVTANHGETNKSYMEQTLEEVKSWNHDVDIVAYTDVKIGVRGVNEIRVDCHPTDILPQIWKTIRDNHGNYDLYVFFVNDYFITENMLDAWLKCREQVRLPYIPGFLIHEVAPDGKLWYPSQHAHYDFDDHKLYGFGDYILCQHTNLHQGSFILDNELLDYVISHPNPNQWIGENHPTTEGPNVNQHYGKLERVDTDVYTTPGIIKLIPISHFKEFIIHHLPNKYVGGWGIGEEEMDKKINELLTTANELWHEELSL